MADDTRILHTLRSMAFERAKGELLSLLHTYKVEYINSERVLNPTYYDVKKSINAFIEDLDTLIN